MKRVELLKIAIMSGDKDTVEWIVEAGGAISDEFVALARQYRQSDIVELLQPSSAAGAH